VTGRPTTIAAAARRHNVPYQILWRLATGGYARQPQLPEELARRLEAALEELRQHQGGGENEQAP
jgi:hypothetical protein